MHTSLCRSRESRYFSDFLTIVKSTWVSHSCQATCLQLSSAISSAVKNAQKYSGTSLGLEKPINIQFHHPTAVLWFASKSGLCCKMNSVKWSLCCALIHSSYLTFVSNREIALLNIVGVVCFEWSPRAASESVWETLSLYYHRIASVSDSQKKRFDMPALSVRSQEERLSKLQRLHCTMFNGAETMHLKAPATYTACQLDAVKFGIDLYNVHLLI